MDSFISNHVTVSAEMFLCAKKMKDGHFFISNSVTVSAEQFPCAEGLERWTVSWNVPQTPFIDRAVLFS